MTMAENKVADDADWLTSMFDQQSELCKRAVNEVNRLRGRVRELEQQIAELPATTYELQERVTILEVLNERSAATLREMRATKRLTS